MKNKINLLPPELTKKEKLSFERLKLYKYKPIIVSIFLPIILWKFLAWGINLKLKTAINRKIKEIKELSEKITRLKMSAEAELKIKQDELNLLRQEISSKEEEFKTLKPIAQLISQRKEFIYEMLKAIAEYIPEEVWLKEISIEKGNDFFSLKGLALNHDKILLFLTKLNQFPYLKQLYLKQSEIKNGDDYSHPVIEFEIVGKLNL